LRTKKDRIINALLILLFLAIMGGAAYFIFKTMTHWNIKELGYVQCVPIYGNKNGFAFFVDEGASGY
jgi:hypothetical protein